MRLGDGSVSKTFHNPSMRTCVRISNTYIRSLVLHDEYVIFALGGMEGRMICPASPGEKLCLKGKVKRDQERRLISTFESPILS